MIYLALILCHRQPKLLEFAGLLKFFWTVAAPALRSGVGRFCLAFQNRQDRLYFDHEAVH